MHYVYFLLLSGHRTYKGSASNLKRRFLEHQQGKVHSTKRFLPCKLLGYEAYLLKSDALRREKFLKTTEGRHLFRQQYRDVLAKESSWSHPTPRPVE